MIYLEAICSHRAQVYLAGFPVSIIEVRNKAINCRCKKLKEVGGPVGEYGLTIMRCEQCNAIYRDDDIISVLSITDRKEMLENVLCL